MKEMSISATIILISSDSKALILQRNSGDSFPNLWTVPGGKLQDSDFDFAASKDFCYYPAEYAAIREVKEETGIEVKMEDLRLLCSMYMTPINRMVISFYAVLDRSSKEISVVLTDNQAHSWIDRNQ